MIYRISFSSCRNFQYIHFNSKNVVQVRRIYYTSFFFSFLRNTSTRTHLVLLKRKKNEREKKVGVMSYTGNKNVGISSQIRFRLRPPPKKRNWFRWCASDTWKGSRRTGKRIMDDDNADGRKPNRIFYKRWFACPLMWPIYHLSGKKFVFHYKNGENAITA